MLQLTLKVPIELSDDETVAIADALGCPVGDLEAALGAYAPAAMREYVDMFAGQALTGVADLRERRLVAILLALADLPADETIARLFNLTSAAARSLLRTTLSRHRNRLRSAAEAAARRFIAVCTQAQAGGDWEARCANVVVIELLNRQLAAAAQPRAPIRRAAGTFDTYVVANGAKIELDGLYA